MGHYTRDLLKLSDFTPGDLWEAATEDDLAEFKRTVESAAAGFAKAKRDLAKARPDIYSTAPHHVAVITAVVPGGASTASSTAKAISAMRVVAPAQRPWVSAPILRSQFRDA